MTTKIYAHFFKEFFVYFRRQPVMVIWQRWQRTNVQSKLKDVKQQMGIKHFSK